MAKVCCILLAVIVCFSSVMGGVYLRDRHRYRPSLLSASADSSASASVQSGGRRGGFGSASADSSSSARASSNGGRGQASSNSQSSASATLSRNDILDYCPYNECEEGERFCSCDPIGDCYLCTYENVLRSSRRRLPLRPRARNNFFDRPARFPRRRGYNW